MFPGGWPGAGLLLLRVAAALPLLMGGSFGWEMPSGGLYMRIIAIGVGILLLGGLWTPVAGGLKTVIELGMMFSPGDDAVAHLLRAALGVSLVMLGPGAWSLDARLFGRKRIDIGKR